MSFTFTTSGLSYTFLAVGAFACSAWFFRRFQGSGGFGSGGGIMGFFLSVFVLVLALEHTLFALGSFFLIDYPDAFYGILVANTLVLALIAPLGVYLLLYLFYPKVSPWPWTITAALYGLFVTASILVSHPQPSLEATLLTRTIDYNLTFFSGMLYYFLWLLYIIPPLIIFFKNFIITASREIKIVSIFIILATLFGALHVTTFAGILQTYDEVRWIFYDITLGLSGFMLIIGFLFIPLVKNIRIKAQKHL